MGELTVAYYGYPFDASGYGEACRATIHALHSAGVKLSVVELIKRSRQISDPLVESLLNQTISPDFHLFHGIPPEWASRAFSLSNVVGMTVWETNVMPSQWRNILNHTLEVWLPCRFNQQVFERALEKPVFVLPHPLLPTSPEDPSRNSCPLNGAAEGRFVFYSLFEWQDRKNPHGILESYLRAFSAADPTLLVLKTNAGATHAARTACSEVRDRVKSDARVEIRAEAWSREQIQALHARGDCYVSLHRGEGWNYPLFEAAARGTPVVATAYSGPLDYLDPAAHRLVRCGLSPVLQPYLYYHPSMCWAEPDLSHAAEQLRWVFENQETARSLASCAAPKLRETYSTEAVGVVATDRLIALLQRTQPKKWQQVLRSSQAQGLRPPAPIPPEWYDHDYFETGRKSNWKNGYKWETFSGLFVETAKFITAVFPEANSFLDIGCAKGFLVRCLREAGKDCWGIDFSSWAINHAESMSASFLRLSDVNDFPFDRKFDVLLALSILETLTEPQIRDLLTRARKGTKTAIFAVIPSYESPGEEEHLKLEDQDLSHVTIRSRTWWHEEFLRAGWRQGAAGGAWQRTSQTNPLCVRMGWKVYVYEAR